MKTLRMHIYIFSFLLFNFALLQAQIPRTLSYQGVLTDVGGKPRSDSTYNFTFSLYDSGSGGTLLWTEAKLLSTKRGLFSTALGDATPFPDSLKFDRSYWLNISVSGIGELSPRIPLTSVGYSMNALRADTAKISIAGGAWSRADSNIYFLNGNVGIGMSGPVKRLDVFGSIQSNTGFITTNQNYNTVLSADANGSYLEAQGHHNLSFYTNGIERLRINADGRIQSSTSFITTYPDYNTVLSADANGSYLEAQGAHNLRFYTNGNERVRIDQSGNIGIGTTTPSEKLEVVGITKTQVLEITGGSDLAEPFPVSENNQLEEGSVVVIDESNPGHVTLSTEPYDKKVAGVVSGAGGIKPGLTLKQEGLMEGDQNIALSGRVYVKATASNGSIKPGDRLVTSSTPGLCMKATDPSRCDGAVIGKSMSALESGEGLVLVLVNLQ